MPNPFSPLANYDPSMAQPRSESNIGFTIEDYVTGFGGSVPQARTTGNSAPIDPLTGRPVVTDALREGSPAAQASISHGFALDTLTEQRRQEALGTLQGALNDPLLNQLSQYASESLKNPGTFDEELIRLIFARGADGASTSARDTARMINSQIGGRGISASSALAQGMAFRNDIARQAQVRGVERDVTIEKLRADTQARASAFQQALGAAQMRQNLIGTIAGVQNQEVPLYGQDALQGLTELIIERQAQENARNDAKKKAKNDLIGGVIGGVASIITKL